MNKLIFWILAIIMLAFSATYFITDSESSFLGVMIFGAAALLAKLKPANQ